MPKPTDKQSEQKRSSNSAFHQCRAHYTDESQRVIQVFVPWQGRERRKPGDRRQLGDRRSAIRYEMTERSAYVLTGSCDSHNNNEASSNKGKDEGKGKCAATYGERRGFVDRRQSVRQHDGYRLAKFNRQPYPSSPSFPSSSS